MLECVVNVSEGRNGSLLAHWRATLGDDCLDLHSDADHNRSVFTLVGEEAPRKLARLAIAHLNLANHVGVHPRLGVVDVVPFVPLQGSTMRDACEARDRFADWAARELDVPCFLYGPTIAGQDHTLPQIRRSAWTTLAPHTGAPAPHATAGAMCVGAREPLIAYNIWLDGPDLAVARAVAAAVRSEHVRALGLQVGRFTQVSMNLVAPHHVGPAEVFDAVAERVDVSRAELVGLAPAAVLANIPRSRWPELDVSTDRTIEWRLAHRRAAD